MPRLFLRSVVARRALQSDFFADQGVERCASLNLDEDDLHALGAFFRF